jgi:hypothetical protein
MALAATASLQLRRHRQPQARAAQCVPAPPRRRALGPPRFALGRYYAGLVVLLHSLFHHNAAEPDCGGLLVL